MLGTPGMLIARFLLYVRTVRLISVPTFSNPFVKKQPWFQGRLRVPEGCSDRRLRSFICSGPARTLRSISSSRSSSTRRGNPTTVLAARTLMSNGTVSAGGSGIVLDVPLLFGCLEAEGEGFPSRTPVAIFLGIVLEIFFCEETSLTAG